MTDEIPPPLEPKPKDPSELMLPWKLADAPRLQLEFLSRSEALSERDRESVKRWLAGYNAYVVSWLQTQYGMEGVKAADAISKATAKRMNENQSAAIERETRDLFERLREEFNDD